MSEKDDLIEKGKAAVRGRSEMIGKAIQSKSTQTSPIPNLNFLDFQREIILITEDIKKLGRASFLMKMKNTLMQAETSPGGKSHIDGSRLAEVSKQTGLRELVSEIVKDPTSTAARVQFIRALIQDQRHYKLPFYKDLLIQASLPVYLGKITPAALEVAGQAYRIYLRQLVNEHKKNLLILRSAQLKKVNVEMIPIESLIKVDPKKPFTPKEAAIVLETKLALKLLDFSRNLAADIRSKITMPLDLYEVEQLSPRHGAVMEFLGNKEVGSSFNKHQLIVRKALAVMDVVKHIPFLHSIGLKIADKLEEIDHKLPAPFVIEGRIHMHAMKILMLRMMLDEYTAKNALTPTFKKMMIAYRKALKLTSISEPQANDVPILGEFAQVVYYSFQHQRLIRITEQGMMEILKIGKKAIDSAMLVNHQYRKLQMQILTAISTIEKPQKTSTAA